MACKGFQIINLEGKSIDISGATSGIGLGSALILARKGAFVISIGRDKRRKDQTFGA